MALAEMDKTGEVRRQWIRFARMQANTSPPGERQTFVHAGWRV